MQTAKQSDWDGVYFDRESGEFVTLDIVDDGVIERDAFTGAPVYEFTTEEFADQNWQFDEIDPMARSDPATVLDEFITDALGSIDHPEVSLSDRYDPVDIEFAREVLRFKLDEEKLDWHPDLPRE